MRPEFDDPAALLPQDLDPHESRAFEKRIVDELRQCMIGRTAGSVIIDEIQLVGSRPDTLVLFRYHHHQSLVGRHAGLVGEPQVEAASLWEFAISADDQVSQGMMETPPVIAASIGSAFNAGELPLVDPQTMRSVGEPPKVFPRVMDDASAAIMRERFDALRITRIESRSDGPQ